MSSSTFASPPRIPPPPLIPGKSPARNAAATPMWSDITATRNPAALTPSPPKRKASLASPSPPTPLIPSFNVATSRPGGLPTTPVPPSSQTQSQSQTQNQSQSQSQYVTVFPRPTCPMSSPDSPTSRAMMKRLLAKPAVPVPYSGSESEGRSVGGMKRAATIAGNGRSEDGRVNEERRRATTSEQRIPMTAFSGSDSDGRGVSTTSGRRNPQEIDKLPSSTPPNERRTSGKPEEKQRKLLRRKPSSSRVTSPSSSPSQTSPPAVGSSSTVKRSASAAAFTLAHPSPHQSHEPSSKQPPLTPASALVQAYRAQEQSQRGHDASPSSTPRPFSSSDPKHLHDNDPATPYYTVFGSSSDRVIPVDSFEARTAGIGWSSEGYFGSEGIKRSGTVKSTSSAGGGLRTLTRKVSGRWKKAQQHAGEEEKEKEKGRVRPRPSLQNPGGRKSDVGVRTRTRARTRSLSVEGLVSDAVVKHPLPLKALNGKVNGRRHARRPSSAENPPPVPGEGGGNKLWRLMKRISTGGLRDKYRAEQHETPAPPPLPLPVPGSAFTSPSPLALDAGKKRALARLLSSESSSRSSSVGGESTRSRSKVRTAPALKTSGSPSHQQGQTQGSGTTRSSSPVSSSDKSAQYAHSSTSSFGVVDVQVEQVIPPVPSFVDTLRKNSRKQQQGVNGVGKYIVHPSQLCKDQPPTPPPSKRSLKHLSIRQPPRPRTADSEDWMIVQSPSVELPSLPFPPRRGVSTLVVSSPDNYKVVSSAATAPTQDDSPAPAPARDMRKKKERDEEEKERASGRESPLLPEFSISGAINTFRPRKSGDRVALKPPPLSVPVVRSAGSSTSPGRSASSPMRSASSPTSRSPTSPKSPSHHTRKSESHTNTNRRSEGGLSVLTIRPGRRRSSSYDLSTTAGAEPLAVFKPVVHGEGSKADRMGSLNPPPATAASAPKSAISSKKSPAATKSPAPASTTSRPTDTPSTISPSSYTPSLRHALTEQEKAQRWDDLLERSARAGGTLHLAGDWDVLQSDLLRYSSTPSELEMAGVGVLG